MRLLMDDATSGSVEAEACHDQIGIPLRVVDYVLDLLCRNGSVLRAKSNGNIVRVRLVALPRALGMDAHSRRGFVERLKAQKRLTLVVEKGDAVLAEELDYTAEIGVEVLLVGAAVGGGGLAGGQHEVVAAGGLVFVGGAVEEALLAEGELLGADPFDGEGAGDADDAGDDLGLVDQLLLLGVALDAGVNLVHLEAPGLAVGEDGVPQGAWASRGRCRRGWSSARIFRWGTPSGVGRRR